MMRDWSQEIRCEYSGSDVRYDFPVRPVGWFRVLGLLPIGFGLYFLWTPGQTVLESIQRLIQGNRDFGTLLFSLFPLLFVVAGCIPLILGLFVLFGRCRVEWREGTLRSSERVGPFRWTRRMPRKNIQKLEVIATMSRTGNAPPKELENFSLLTVLYEDGTRKFLVLGYPKDWLLAVAQELKSRIGSASLTSESPEVEVVEQLEEPEQKDDSIFEQPAGSTIQFQQLRSGIRLSVPAAGLWKGSKGLFFFALLWCAFCGVFTGLFLFDHFKKEEALTSGFWVFVPLFWFAGLGMLAGAINMGRRRAEVLAESGRLQIQTTGLFGTKQREWARGEVAAVRMDASGMEVNERPVLELQVHPVTGKKAGFLAGRDEAELRWMAALLRRALQVPARPVERETDGRRQT
jgi:hypothetical protein